MGSADADVWVASNGDYWKAFWVGKDGKKKSKSIGPKSKLSRRQARVRAKEMARESDKPEKAPRLSEWMAAFSGSRPVQANTKATYRETGTYLTQFFDNDPPIGDITRAEAFEWRDELASGKLTDQLNEKLKRDTASDPSAKGVNGAGRAWRTPSESTVARHVRFAKMLFKEAVDRDIIAMNPFDRLKGNPPKVIKDWRDVTRDDMAKVLDASPSPGWRALFGLCRWAGLRLGEAVALRWADVDWDANQIRVNAKIEKETTKKRKRIAPIEPARCPSGLTRLLREVFEAAPAGAVYVCEGVPKNNVRRDGLGILRRSGVGAYAKPFHTLRKNCETDWAQEYPQHVVSEWIGHDINVSQEHYLKVPAELYAPPPPDPPKDGKAPETHAQIG